MKADKNTLSQLPKFQGYLEGKKLDAFFETYEIKFAAGHWCAGDFCDRFAPLGYNSNKENFKSDIVSQIQRVAEAGIAGIEFHEAVFIDKNYRKNKKLIDEVKKALKKYKITPTNMNTNLWTDPKWKLGGITNANPAVRKDALEIALQGIEIAKELGCASVALWPGSDGWDYNFQANYGVLLDRFVQGCIEINKKAKKLGLKFGIEAKLHEPREGNMIISTTPKAMLVADCVNSACGGKNMGVAIDYGHEQMYGNEPADNLYTAKKFGIPVVNFHVNNAKLHSNDEDRVAGTGDNWRLADFCYAAIDTGYQGWFGEDQFTYRMDPVKAMSLSRELFANVMKKALMIYDRRDELKKAQATGDAGKTIDVVKRILT
ncbi:MAG: sugar phosphate isomerase/epimerase family protein [bacterium]|nr:sugar phosphate isomerase/epimerase family protein [bacterium]